MQEIYSLSPGLTFFGVYGIDIFERFTILPGGELHFRIKLNEQSFNEKILLLSRLNNSNDIIKLIMVGKTLYEKNIKFDVFIPYIPGGRQDRVEIKGEPFSLKVYVELINSVPFDNIITFSPHSNVTTALLRNSDLLIHHEHYYNILCSTINQGDAAWIIAPDEGSSKRTYNIFKLLKQGFPLLRFAQGLKIRDPENGLVTGVNCLENNLEKLPCFLFDDICDGGRTFNLLAANLEQKNCGPLYLSVDHGIFSQGLSELKSHFVKIWSTNSIKDEIKDETFNVIIQKL